MKMFLLPSLLFSLLAIDIREVSSQALILDNTIYLNNSFALIEDIGEEEHALMCRTSIPRCCREVKLGQWYFPNGSLLLTNGDGHDLYRNRDDTGNVRLNRRNNVMGPHGLYTCEIPNTGNVLVNLTITLHTANDFPTVTTQPLPQFNVIAGSTVSFSITAEQATNYLWHFKGDALSPRVGKYEGVRDSRLSILDVEASDEGHYSCLVGNAILSVISETAQLTVITLNPPTLVTQPDDALSVIAGFPVMFSVNATGRLLSYTWQRSDGTQLTEGARYVGVATSTLTILSVQLGDAGGYVCTVTNAAGSVQSEEAQLTVMVPPILVAQPDDMHDVVEGSNVTFSVAATGLRIRYEWMRFDRIDTQLTELEGARYVGVATSTLTIFSVQLGDTGAYVCTVTNSAGSVQSEEAQLTILAPPILLAQPEAMVDVAEGSNVTFSVIAAGYLLNYTWQRSNETQLTEGARYVGVAISTLTILSVQFGDVGGYVCTVTNTAGSVQSEEAQLTIYTVDEITSLSINSTITSATVNWTASISHPNMTVYELQYFPIPFPSHIITLNTSLTTQQVVGLIPLLRYQFRVRLYSSQGRGDWVSEMVTLDQKIPPVKNLSMTVTSGNTIRVTWDPPTDLPGWNISRYYLTYRAYLPDTLRPEKTFRMTVEGGETTMMVDAGGVVVEEEEEEVTHEVEVLAALVVDGVEGIGEVKGEKAVVNKSLSYEKLPFQVMIGPVEHCISWEAEKANRIRSILQEAVLAAIKTRCDCLISDKSINVGIFSCRGAQQGAVTYRSTVVGLNATELLNHIQDWVSSNTTITMDWYLMDVYSSCPVTISRLDEPECQFL